MLVGNATSHGPAQGYQESLSPIAANPQIDEFKNVFRQCLEDHHRQPEGPGMFVYGMSQLLGQTFTRRLSNLVSCLRLGHFYPAQRNYPVLGACDERAQKFQPRLSSMNEQQVKPTEFRYEILPAAQDKDTYSIIYYIGFPTEELPVPILGTLYNWVRPILYGSKQDWEAIQVDIDKKTDEPVGLSYETSNYGNTPSSYNLTAGADLHLLTKVSKTLDGTWTRTVRQKSGSVQTSQIENPFRDGTHPELCLVAWNGSLDICACVAQNSNLTQTPLNAPKLQFLDIETFQNEGFDLRATWVEKQLNLVLPPRKRLAL